MRRCLELARRAEGRTSPNPIVGSVIVGDDGQLLAEGYHLRPGELHGEAAALAALGGKAPGATLYVNLEPCAHRDGGRTSCTMRVLASGVRRVVIGALDPIPGHGGGAVELAAAGIEVTTGVLADECEAVNAPFFTAARKQRPYLVLKAGCSLDGKIATTSGESRWITGAAARADGHRLRDRLDAIMVGIGTVLADDPRLTVRDLPVDPADPDRVARDPVRIVVDSGLRTPPTAALLPAKGSPARTIIAGTTAAPVEREHALVAAGAEVWRLDANGDGRVDLGALMARLVAAKIYGVLVEGGAGLHGGLVAAGLVDQLRLYVAPIILGGAAAPSWLGGPGVTELSRAPRLRFGPPQPLGDDLLLVATPVE
jgi:diaminohydroxyphosphoribosylaminopyrimidine deaminase/5-amino-6-(5-phosphoribosylamino)uracil reductase